MPTKSRDLQCLYIDCFHDNLSGTRVSPFVKPAVGIHPNLHALQGRYVDIPLDTLQERQQTCDTHGWFYPRFSRGWFELRPNKIFLFIFFINFEDSNW